MSRRSFYVTRTGIRGGGFTNPTLREMFDSLHGETYEHEPPHRSGEFVYFLHAKIARRIKIGTTRIGPLQRVRALVSQHPELRQLDIELVGAIDGGRPMERVIHERFAAHRIKGEWFTDAILADVHALLEDDRQWFNEQ